MTTSMTTLSGIDWNWCPAWIGISVRLRSESLSGIIGIRSLDAGRERVTRQPAGCYGVGDKLVKHVAQRTQRRAARIRALLVVGVGDALRDVGLGTLARLQRRVGQVERPDDLPNVADVRGQPAHQLRVGRARRSMGNRTTLPVRDGTSVPMAPPPSR